MRFHYFTTNEIHRLLISGGFEPLEVTHLSQLLVQMGNAFHTSHPDDNIVFIARARA
jgi:hypothetical protein